MADGFVERLPFPSTVNFHPQLKIADEVFLFQAVHPFFFDARLFLGFERFFDFAANFAERLDVRGARLLDEHEVAGVGRFDGIADLPGFEGEGGVAEFLAQDGAFDPTPCLLYTSRGRTGTRAENFSAIDRREQSRFENFQSGFGNDGKVGEENW